MEQALEYANKAYVIDEWFAHVFGDAIGYIFYTLGYDHYRKLSKIILFIGGLLVPIGLCLRHFLRVFVLKEKPQD